MSYAALISSEFWYPYYVTTAIAVNNNNSNNNRVISSEPHPHKLLNCLGRRACHCSSNRVLEINTAVHIHSSHLSIFYVHVIWRWPLIRAETCSKLCTIKSSTKTLLRMVVLRKSICGDMRNRMQNPTIKSVSETEDLQHKHITDKMNPYCSGSECFPTVQCLDAGLG
jgi:hypothetical protein